MSWSDVPSFHYGLRRDQYKAMVGAGWVEAR
jgi:hypothetical protein